MRTSKSEWLYNTLKKDILELRFQPGEKISEVSVAEKFSTSRAPVRDAITRLQQDGLIVVEPQVGSFIAEISLKQLSDMLQIRLALEPMAARLAVSHIPDYELRSIRNELDSEVSRTNGICALRQKEIDKKIHLSFLKYSGNEYLSKFGQEMYIQSQWVQLYTTLHMNRRRQESLEETKLMLLAFESRDADVVYDTVLKHLQNINAAFSEAVKQISR